MTRYFFFSILLLVLATGVSNHVFAKAAKQTSSAVANHHSQEQNESNALPLQAAAPKNSTRATAPEHSSEQKAHGPKLEEVPHIHHFHKERVKKVKKHHKKIWTLSQILLVLCHLALLVMAYSHITH